MDIINYTKLFKTFDEGLNEIKELVPDVLNYISESASTEDMVLIDLVNKFKESTPVPSNPSFPYTYTFSADASHGIMFGTDKRLRFGWKSKRIENHREYIFKITFPNSKNKSTCELNLINNNWKHTVYNNNSNKKNQVNCVRNVKEPETAPTEVVEETTTETVES